MTYETINLLIDSYQQSKYSHRDYYPLQLSIRKVVDVWNKARKIFPGRREMKERRKSNERIVYAGRLSLIPSPSERTGLKSFHLTRVRNENDKFKCNLKAATLTDISISLARRGGNELLAATEEICSLSISSFATGEPSRGSYATWGRFMLKRTSGRVTFLRRPHATLRLMTFVDFERIR